MNKAASLAVKSLLGVGSVAGAASGGIVLWNQKFSGKNGEVSESPESNRNEDKENQNDLEKVENLDNPNNKEEGADERGSQKVSGELQTTGNSVEGETGEKDRIKQQNVADDSDDPEAKARKEEEVKKMEQNSRNWKGWQFSLWSEEKSWLPAACISEDRAKSYIECDLTSGELKKIKFKELGDGKEAVTIAPSDNVSVKLKILQHGDTNKKYTFINESSSKIVISKGANSVTLRASGSTEFLSEKEGLVMVKLKDYGIPETCMKPSRFLALIKPGQSQNPNAKGCVLSAEELSKIKFHGFPDGVESKVTPIWVGSFENRWNHNQAIILTINEGKYGFYNFFSDILRNSQGVHRPITITRGGVSVTLDGNMESEFTVVNDSLKKVEVNVLGFPKNCEIGDEDQKECVLSDNDIRRLKLKETGVSPDLWDGIIDGNREMILRIKKVSGGDFPDNKKYILTSKGNSNLTIFNTAEVKDGEGKVGESRTKSLQFDKGVEKTFKNEGNQLVLVN